LITFKELGLSDPLLATLETTGYQNPTPIQAQMIPYVLAGKDVLGTAQTGTGKTAAFILPLIDILASGRAKARMPRSIVLEPTRELAVQVKDNFQAYGKNHKLKVGLLIGGESFTEQEKVLNRGVDVLIATPGRFLDLYQNGKILLSDIKLFVIDEADRMLDMGFIPDVTKIAGILPKKRQTLLLSATMAPEIKKLSTTFMMQPQEVSVTPPAQVADTIETYLVAVKGTKKTLDKNKRATLREILKTKNITNAIIFCNRKIDVTTLHTSLNRHGFASAELHGDMNQAQRLESLGQFKKGNVNFLIATDIAARGIDIDDMPCVVNFEVPINAEDYVHRIGRTGRAGKLGVAYTFLAAHDQKKIQNIFKLTGQEIPYLSGYDVGHEATSCLEECASETSSSPFASKKFSTFKGKKHISDSSTNTSQAQGTQKPSAQKSSPVSKKTAPQKFSDVKKENLPQVGFGKNVPAFMRPFILPS